MAEMSETGTTQSIIILIFNKLFLQPTQRKEDREEHSPRGEKKLHAKF
jgi:hypothetical protein